MHPRFRAVAAKTGTRRRLDHFTLVVGLLFAAAHAQGVTPLAGASSY